MTSSFTGCWLARGLLDSSVVDQQVAAG